MTPGSTYHFGLPPEAADSQDQLHTAIVGWTLELAPHGLFTTDTSLRLTSWNQWLETHTRKKAADVLGKPLVEVIPSLIERRLNHYYRDALQGESKVLSRSLHGYLLPLPSTAPHFSHMQQSARIAPLLLQGRIAGTITIIEDVTEREWQYSVLRQARQRSELLASTLAHLISARDPQQLVSQIFARIATALRLDCCMHHVLEPDSQRVQLHSATGLSPVEAEQCAQLHLGQGLCGTVLQTREQLLVNQLQKQPHPNLQPCKGFGLRAVAAFPLLVNQRLLGSLAFGTRSRDSFSEEEVQFLYTVSQYAAVALDRALKESELSATHAELAEAQTELARHAASLEKTVATRTRELRETISQLESFSYTVAHDLRAPIRTFENYAKILLEDYGAQLDAQAQGLLGNMARAAHRLDALTKDVLNYTKIATQKTELAPVDPAETLKDVMVMNPALQPPNAEVALVRPLQPVLAHPTLLSQCLSNLLSNAVKFAKPGTIPHIVIRSEPRSGPAPAQASATLLRPAFGPPAALESLPPPASTRPRVRLWIQDNGIGIDPEAQGKVFGIFERGRGVSKVPGTGIGLAIVAKAVERMEGACGVESAPGQGSRFWIELLAA